MTTIWKPDTCECEIEYSGNFENPKFIKVCSEHEGKTPLDVIKHNQRFNKKYSDVTDKKERRKLISKDKVMEKKRCRIKKYGL